MWHDTGHRAGARRRQSANLSRCLHNFVERDWIEAGSANQGAIDIVLSQQLLRVLRLDAAAVEDSHRVGNCLYPATQPLHSG